MSQNCPKCQHEMAKAKPHVPIAGGFVAFREPVKALGTNAKTSFSLLVCPACGYTEMYADNPAIFREQ